MTMYEYRHIVSCDSKWRIQTCGHYYDNKPQEILIRKHSEEKEPITILF